ncbi:hypothetical protein NIES22_65820 [Calothrix brevissima NIES-22]|nr:hypothetical protein NIES22_65820 [Calothrix brevissima NIES-22]
MAQIAKVGVGSTVNRQPSTVNSQPSTVNRQRLKYSQFPVYLVISKANGGNVTSISSPKLAVTINFSSQLPTKQVYK